MLASDKEHVKKALKVYEKGPHLERIRLALYRGAINDVSDKIEVVRERLSRYLNSRGDLELTQEKRFLECVHSYLDETSPLQDEALKSIKILKENNVLAIEKLTKELAA